MKKFILGLALVAISVPALAQENYYGTMEHNPWSDTTTIILDSKQDPSLQVEDKEDTITPEERGSNPTGQVSDQEFEGLIQRGGSGRR